ncbi:uncharacterized protein LOC134769520 [Penaeus indicus]|uniref:uncharacterized protein LOC134769520 n=1 Tax=Penaeus indicus TaxID=29960 RepID=UPI00300D4D84
MMNEVLCSRVRVANQDSSQASYEGREGPAAIAGQDDLGSQQAPAVPTGTNATNVNREEDDCSEKCLPKAVSSASESSKEKAPFQKVVVRPNVTVDMKQRNKLCHHRHGALAGGVQREGFGARVSHSRIAAKHRRIATTRERCRVHETNKAFDALRSVLPAACVSHGESSPAAKMATLRLAIRYIAALAELLEEDDLETSRAVSEEGVSASSSGGEGDGRHELDADDFQLKEEQEILAELSRPTAAVGLAPDDHYDDLEATEDTYILALARIFREAEEASEDLFMGGQEDVCVPAAPPAAATVT